MCRAGVDAGNGDERHGDRHGRDIHLALARYAPLDEERLVPKQIAY